MNKLDRINKLERELHFAHIRINELLFPFKYNLLDEINEFIVVFRTRSTGGATEWWNINQNTYQVINKNTKDKILKLSEQELSIGQTTEKTCDKCDPDVSCYERSRKSYCRFPEIYRPKKIDFSLAQMVIDVLDIKGRAGCNDKSWIGFQNGNGTEIGSDIERLIKKAKKQIEGK